MTVERAIDVLRAGRGKQWNPVAVDALIRAVAEAVQLPARDTDAGLTHMRPRAQCASGVAS